MELLTHGGEHHEIDDGGWLMMTTTPISPLRSTEWTPDLFSRGRTGVGGGGRILLSDFFLPEREYMKLELRSVEVQGAHEAGGALGGGAPPTLMDRVWAPWS